MVDALGQWVSSELNRLQSEGSETFIVYRANPVGLGGQITGRIDALRLALALGRQVLFARVDDPPYSQTFEPMGPPPPSGAGDDWPNIDLAKQQTAAIVIFDAKADRVRGSSEIEDRLLALVSSRSSLNITDGAVLDGAILRWMRLTPQMKIGASEALSRLGVSRDTLGVHFRRGDKQVETAFVPASEINRQIASLYQNWKFRSIYVASDSYEAKYEIKPPAGVALIFDEQETRYNNANHKMLIGNPSLAGQETSTAIKNIVLLSSCGGIIGQDNAHFARIAASVIQHREGTDRRIVLISGRFLENNSTFLRTMFRAKSRARAVVRALLPHMTASARMARRTKK